MFADWRALALHRDVQMLSSVLARRWRVWVGFVSAAGDQVFLGRGQFTPQKPLCALFLANPTNTEGGLSCSASFAHWGSAESSGTSHLLKASCHAGLRAAFVPVLDSQQNTVGRVYASGFLTQQDELQGTISLKQRHSALTGEQLEDVSATPVLAPHDVDVLLGMLDALSQTLSLHLEETQVHVGGQGATQFEQMIGQSRSMLKMFRLVDRIARGSSTALILGENGTGKELVAKAIHRRSRRRDRPFVVQNCAAIPPDLMESELFGHKRGAFSGAHRDRQGLFETADHGTFFLDEIGEMSLPLQAKLLRVLQEGTFLPVGDSTYRRVDVRIICATNRDLSEMVRQGKFRQDLYYRVNVIAVQTPPLRARLDDIPLLSTFFLNKACADHAMPAKRLSPQTLALLQRYDWPGNVRQLENEMERLVILSGNQEVIESSLLSSQISGIKQVPLSFEQFDDMTLPEVQSLIERQMIASTLEDTGWNKSKAARILGISRRNLIRKVAQLQLDEGSSTTTFDQ